MEDFFGYATVLFKYLTYLYPFFALGKALFNEIIDRHQPLLSINDKKTIASLFIEKYLRYREP